MEKRGYIIEILSNQTHPDIVKNNLYYDPNVDFHQKPIETFLFKIEIKKEENNKKRKREEREEIEEKIK